MATELREEQLVRDEILYLPVDVIDPDPAQPRLQVDAELADSIAQHGVLQPIQVRPHPEVEGRWMLVDGERRYRGALGAKLKTIPAQITLEVEDAADRLVRQIVRNEGKPLTPVEEAKAFKRIIDQRREAGDKQYGVVSLAKELGIAKSTVSDRLALTDIPAFWLDLMVTGPLQPSHAPLLRKWAKVPEKYQQKALEQMRADYRWPGGESYSKGKKGERIYGEVLETLLRTYMTKFIKPVSEVRGYEGPTERGRFESYGEAKTYAMDPSKWGPIHRKRLGEQRSKQGQRAAATGQSNKARTPSWVKAAIAGGAEHRTEKYFHVGGYGPAQRFAGVTWIIDRGQWFFDRDFGHPKLYDPSALCAVQDPSKLIIVSCNENDWVNGKQREVTRWYAGTKDDAAVEQARSAFLAARMAEYARINRAVAEELDAVAVSVTGSGARAVLELLATNGFGPALYDLCAVLEIPDVLAVKKKEDLAASFAKLAEDDANRLLTALAKASQGRIPATAKQLEAWEAEQQKLYASTRIGWGSTAAEAEEDDDAPDPADDIEREIATEFEPEAQEDEDDLDFEEDPEPAHAGAED